MKSDASTLVTLTRSRLAPAARFSALLLGPRVATALAHPLPSCADRHGYYTAAMTGFAHAARADSRLRYASALAQEQKAWGLLVRVGFASPIRHYAHGHPKPTPASSAPVVAAPSPTGCYPLSDEGTCYEPGEYCRDSDQGMTGVAGDGESIICEDNDGLRWEPA